MAQKARKTTVVDGIVRVGTGAGDVSTLRAAHEVLVGLRPHPMAMVVVWVRYHEMSARVYEQVADVDRYHHFECLHHASREREHAKVLRGRENQGEPAMVGVVDFTGRTGLVTE
ncbi:MAG: hypothetical protein M3548_18375 [Actinomycetota bacterium]|nr:hypothetical protein [Actinomycetota bacterium]